MADFIYAGDAGAFKTCNKCQSFLATREFGRHSKCAFGFNVVCRRCVKASGRERYLANPDKISGAAKAWAAANPEKAREKARERQRRRYAKSGDLIKAQRAKRRLMNIDAERAKKRAAARKRRLCPKARIEDAIRAGVINRIRVGRQSGKRTFETLGYTAEQLMAHLERRFEKGMSWENFGRGGWHIDHETPLSAFNYTSPDHLDFKRAWALRNLRPLWEPENLRKGSRLSDEFQPSLAI